MWSQWWFKSNPLFVLVSSDTNWMQWVPHFQASKFSSMPRKRTVSRGKKYVPEGLQPRIRSCCCTVRNKSCRGFLHVNQMSLLSITPQPTDTLSEYTSNRTPGRSTYGKRKGPLQHRSNIPLWHYFLNKGRDVFLCQDHATICRLLLSIYLWHLWPNT